MKVVLLRLHRIWLDAPAVPRTHPRCTATPSDGTSSPPDREGRPTHIRGGRRPPGRL